VEERFVYTQPKYGVCLVGIVFSHSYGIEVKLLDLPYFFLGLLIHNHSLHNTTRFTTPLSSQHHSPRTNILEYH
jgi:hypothetical protein